MLRNRIRVTSTKEKRFRERKTFFVKLEKENLNRVMIARWEFPRLSLDADDKVKNSIKWKLCFFKDEEFDKTFLNMLYKVVAVSSFLQLLKREILLKSSKFPFRFELFQFQLKRAI